jgi:hypothetical protein
MKMGDSIGNRRQTHERGIGQVENVLDLVCVHFLEDAIISGTVDSIGLRDERFNAMVRCVCLCHCDRSP